MPLYTIRYDATERTVEDVDIEAESLDEAKRIVREYEFDNGNASFVTSYEWSLSNIRTPEDDRWSSTKGTSSLAS